MSSLLSDLADRIGTYGGHGINDADQPFHGELTLAALPGGAGIELQLRATGIDGTEYQVERGWVAPDDQGQVALWAVSSVAPYVGKMSLVRSIPADGAERVLVFASGDDGSLRTEIRFELWGDGSVGLRHRSAAPGASWVTRAEVRCRRA
jgi:hypothetical protein